jgi:aspartate-semialdehyde dehydrogenase
VIARRGPARRPRVPVAVLGATGAVGQTFVRLLADHPWFELREVAASERSAGRPYREVTRWLEGTLGVNIGATTVAACEPRHITSPIVFSALDSSVAGEIEGAFARAGHMVLSNARNYRMDADVPLVIPEVNGDHLDLLATQRAARGWTGGIVTNANCAATVAAMALAPLHERFRVRQLFITTMQAISGAGYPGVASLDILGNVIPFIKDEEPKIETELCKLLGRLGNGAIEMAAIAISAQANRVPVEHGHTVCMSVKLEASATIDAVRGAYDGWRGARDLSTLPSAPRPAIVVRSEDDRPQARRDVDTGRGMAVVVGRIREDPVLDVRLVALGHNTIRGAAGGSILNAELLYERGELPLP